MHTVMTLMARAWASFQFVFQYWSIGPVSHGWRYRECKAGRVKECCMWPWEEVQLTACPDRTSGHIRTPKSVSWFFRRHARDHKVSCGTVISLMLLTPTWLYYIPSWVIVISGFVFLLLLIYKWLPGRDCVLPIILFSVPNTVPGTQQMLSKW